MLRPLRDRIVVKPLERKASERLFVVSADKFSLGEVVRVGPKVESVKVGERVRFGTADNYLNFTEFKGHLIMSEADVCFVEDAA